MTESDEHRFVTSCFLDISDELSRSQLYGYREADRGGFDFACVLQRDRSRVLVGQTLTHHAEGIEKDLNWLLFSGEAELPVYLFASSTRNESRINEVLHRTCRQLPDRTAILRLFRYPADFDADKDEHRSTVRAMLRDQILDDLLLNILFGRLSDVDIRFFLDSTGIPGLTLAALEQVVSNGFINIPHLAKPLQINPSTLRPRLQALVAAGMFETLERASMYRATQRARVFLKVCNILMAEKTVNPELSFVMGRLNLAPLSFAEIDHVSMEDSLKLGNGPRDLLQRLALEVHCAQNRFGAPISGGPYHPNEARVRDDARWIGR